MNKKVKVMENKLSRLGLLGIFGLLSLGSGIPYLAVFMVFFLFFSFSGVAPDEMFQQHVQKAGLRAFYVYLASTVTAILLVIFRSGFVHKTSWYMEVSPEPRAAISEQMAQMGEVFGWIFVVTVCVFAFTLMYYSYREKKAMGDQLFIGLREFVAESPVWGAIVIYTIIGIVVEVVSGVFAVSFASTKAMDGSLYVILAALIAVAVVLLWAGEFFGFARLGLRWQGLKRGLLWGVPAIMAVYVLALIPYEPLLFSSLSELTPALGVMFLTLAAVILNTFYNEVMCRGLVLNIFMERWGHNRAGIYRALVAGAALVCLPGVGLYLLSGRSLLMCLSSLVTVFSFSMFFGALYLRSGNLWVTVIARGCVSAFVTIMGFLTMEGFSLATMSASPADAEPGLIIRQTLLMALLLLPAFLLARGIEPRPPILVKTTEPEVIGHAENPA